MRGTLSRARALATAGAMFLVVAMVATACGGGDNGKASSSQPGAPAKVRVQLSWIPDGQFAGYLMARDKGFYKAENLDVTLLPGGPNVNAVQQVVTGAADMTINKVSELYAARDKRLPVISIAQFDQRSSFPLVAFKNTGINGPKDFKGKKVGIWYGGDEYEFFALMQKVGLDPKKDMQLFEQGFTMDPFLKHEYQVAMVTTFNELNVIRLSGVKDSQLTVVNPSDYGISIPHGALIANQRWLDRSGNKDAAARFVRATLKGWDYAFDHTDEAADVAAKSALAAGGDAATKDLKQLQTMSINAIKELQYPAGFPREQHGKIDPALYQNVANIVKEFGYVKKDLDVTSAYDPSIWQAAASGAK
jgi:NitT/TauT family transport system substrate-binding protein